MGEGLAVSMDQPMVARWDVPWVVGSVAGSLDTRAPHLVAWKGFLKAAPLENYEAGKMDAMSASTMVQTWAAEWVDWRVLKMAESKADVLVESRDYWSGAGRVVVRVAPMAAPMAEAKEQLWAEWTVDKWVRPAVAWMGVSKAAWMAAVKEPLWVPRRADGWGLSSVGERAANLDAPQVGLWEILTAGTLVVSSAGRMEVHLVARMADLKAESKAFLMVGSLAGTSVDVWVDDWVGALAEMLVDGMAV